LRSQAPRDARDVRKAALNRPPAARDSRASTTAQRVGVTCSTTMGVIDPEIDLTESSFVAGALVGEKFVLRRPLATGGSGEVWVATNRATRGIVALKLVRRPSALAAARFRQEAELSAAVTHRNVVRVFD